MIPRAAPYVFIKLLPSPLHRLSVFSFTHLLDEISLDICLFALRASDKMHTAFMVITVIQLTIDFLFVYKNILHTIMSYGGALI